MRPFGVKRVFRFSARRPEDVRDDIRDELALHVELRTAELVSGGMTPADAAAQARRELGAVDRAVADCARSGQRLERRRTLARVTGELRQDLVYGARLIARGPGIAAAAILTLAIAIGANTAIFSVVNALLFKPIPVAAPEQLSRVQTGESQTSWPNYVDLRTRSRAGGVFRDLIAHRMLAVSLAGGPTPERLTGELTSPNYLQVLGVPPAIGRIFDDADTDRDVVVLADHLWRTRFAGAPDIVGRLVTLQGRSRAVVGVMPRGFRGLSPPGLLPDFWIPVDDGRPSGALADRGVTQFELVGRLAAGVAHEQAQAALRVAARTIRAEHPELPEPFVEVNTFALTGLGAFRGMGTILIPVLAFLALLTLASLFVLLIGCANIAGLLLGRAAARRREIAVRLALGASRGRLLRQLLTESLLLAIAGGVAGVLLSLWLTQGVGLATSQLPVTVDFDLRLDRAVLFYALALTMVTSIVFGLAPARRASRFDVVSSLKTEGGATDRFRLRRGILIGQVVACSALLLWSGLFVRSLSHVRGIDIGFQPSGVVIAGAELDRASFDARTGERIFTELQHRIASLPAVESAGLAGVVPLALTGREEFYVRLGAGDDTRIRVTGNRLTPGWFDTVKIPRIAGRDFSWDDRDGAPAVAIVNETLARRFPQGAVGQRLGYGTSSLQIVGVVRDSKYRTLGETIPPTVYLPFRQAYMPMMTLHVRTSDRTRTMARIVEEMRRLAPDAVVSVGTMDDAVAAAVLPARIGAAATGALGGVAVLLAMIGVYGLVSFAVTQRTREIGVRKALGASSRDVVRLIVGSSATLCAAGLVPGLALGALGASALGGFLAGVSSIDPLTLVGVSVVILGAAVAASLVPSLRAARQDPLVALRTE